MKIRNYLMYWANRLMDNKFKSEYYQANLIQFWNHTYESLCIGGGLSVGVSLLFFPWGINFSEYHPLYNAGWGFAFAQFTISCITAFTSMILFTRIIPDADANKIERSVWLFIVMFLSSLMLQHIFTKFLYRTIPVALVASLVPVTLFLGSVIAISKLPENFLNIINEYRDKVIAGVAFMFMDPLTGSFRLTLLLEKIFGKPPEKQYSVVKDLAVPKPKDYKIWGVRSNAEKELQKIMDE